VTPRETDFLLRSFFLVGLFNLFFLLLYQGYLPNKLTTLVSLLFGPLLTAFGHTLITGDGFWFTVAEAGMIYTMEIMLTFAILILMVVALEVSASVVQRNFGKLGSTLLICGLQGLFLVPGGGAVYIFSRVIINNVFTEMAATHGVWSPLALISYALVVIPIIQNIWTFFHHLKNESMIS
jgi:hypothetical protein